MNVCKVICNECPFSNQSLNGWLSDYSVEDVMDFMRTETSFPCHKMVVKDTSFNKVNKLIELGEIKLCRGYVESIIKSAKSPFQNKQLVEAIKFVRSDGLSNNSMSIWDFKKHHEKFVD